MSSHQTPFDHLFEKLMRLEAGDERETLFVELLHYGSELYEPLSEFLTRAESEACLGPLVDLLGKLMDPRCGSILMRYLESSEPALRRAAANALGWNHVCAALETLDNLEGNDPDAHVRLECRAAIEEILRDFPKLRKTLRHHQPLDETDAEIAGEYDKIPTEFPDAHQRMKLIAALPRLLARKYCVVPLHFSPNDRLHFAVPISHERRLVAQLAALSGHFVELHPWPMDRIHRVIDEFYTLGDDDFCTFHSQLTPLARDEVVERIIETIHPEEPVGPLNEANDAVGAVQQLLSACYSMAVRRLVVQLDASGMAIMAELADSEPVKMEPPELPLRMRFIDTLRILAGLDLSLGPGHQENGIIRIPFCDVPFFACVTSEKAIGSDRIEIHFKNGAPEAT